VLIVIDSIRVLATWFNGGQQGPSPLRVPTPAGNTYGHGRPPKMAVYGAAAPPVMGVAYG
jgi:hypothetical protein